MTLKQVSVSGECLVRLLCTHFFMSKCLEKFDGVLLPSWESNLPQASVFLYPGLQHNMRRKIQHSLAPDTPALQFSLRKWKSPIFYRQAMSRVISVGEFEMTI